MPIDGYNLLAPNTMGSELANSGVRGLTANYGYGVAQATKANPQAEADQKSSVNPTMDALRTAKAREFGLNKETVGF